MSRLHCDLIKDLLPLYTDDVCSEQTKVSVEEHLRTCESCREMYEAMQENPPERSEIALDPELKDDIAFIRNVKRRFTRRQLVVIFILVPIFVLLLMLSPYIHAELSAIHADDIKVTELYELSNGDIFCTIESSKAISALSAGNLMSGDKDEEGREYCDGVIAAGSPSALTTMLDSSKKRFPVLIRSQSFIFTTTKKVEYGGVTVGGKDVDSHCRTIKYEGPFNEELVIWKEGQTLEPAPERIEKMLKESSVPDYFPSVTTEQLKIGDVLVIY
ncbi:zf-HC2 domain-containing protein [Extibacter muris]|uniref:zf-HC2 domain-containing protein n=1 Tax=Extibacter muris TaxID=1796622 RepID=UPI001D06553D|nr:zf-HC2 domain-containing protein [Extibacter muris]MCB6202996.1 zf-HC2 domain-containing protein [Extibacter muris]MCQ4664039.1 zf-HC2 domain-containing protein [Extibacter muris]MCQ4693345.1 zf-HC2 domain-containing protein [Extibacter muris]